MTHTGGLKGPLSISTLPSGIKIPNNLKGHLVRSSIIKTNIKSHSLILYLMIPLEKMTQASAIYSASNIIKHFACEGDFLSFGTYA